MRVGEKARISGLTVRWDRRIAWSLEVGGSKLERQESVIIVVWEN